MNEPALEPDAPAREFDLKERKARRRSAVVADQKVLIGLELPSSSVPTKLDEEWGNDYLSSVVALESSVGSDVLHLPNREDGAIAVGDSVEIQSLVFDDRHTCLAFVSPVRSVDPVNEEVRALFSRRCVRSLLDAHGRVGEGVEVCA